MKKGKIVATMAFLACATGITSLTPATALTAERIDEDGAVRWETDAPFIVTSIVPKKGYLTMVYTDQAKNGYRVSNANIVWEKETGVGGEFVSELGTSRPDWAQTAFNREIKGTGYFVNKYEQMYALPETPLTENTSGVLYYYITVNKNATYSTYGSVDYSSCLNNPLFNIEDGTMECRLEITDEGEPYYHPYQNGVRLEKTKEEGGMGGIGDIKDVNEPAVTVVESVAKQEAVTELKAPNTGEEMNKSVSTMVDGTPNLSYNWSMEGLKIVLVFVIGFFLAQAIKSVIGIVTKKAPKGWNKNFRSIISYVSRSGGYPAGHAASFVGATTYLGLIEGFNSNIFGLAVCVALVVLYDSINVRYAVGEQGKILTALADKCGMSEKKTRLVEGHTLPQILAGSAMGIAVALIFYVIF